MATARESCDERGAEKQTQEGRLRKAASGLTYSSQGGGTRRPARSLTNYLTQTITTTDTARSRRLCKPRRLLARKAVWLSGGAPVVDKKGKGALRVLDAPTLDTDTLACRARPSTRARHSPATADP